MKNYLTLSKAIILLLVILVFACRKSITPAPNTPVNPITTVPDSTKTPVTTGPVPYPESASSNCPNMPSYGDSIVYPQPLDSGKDYIIRPVNSPGGGTFLSWPAGLVIDPHNGAIDITQSATGMRYTIGFVKAGTHDTCIQNLIIGGAGYLDSIYVLANNATKALPYIEANPSLPLPGGCHFDLTNSANNMKVVMDHGTGVIDLQNTAQQAFGPIPLDGATLNPSFEYTIPDASNNAIQTMTLQITYYSSKSLIPQTLLNEIESRRLNALLNQLIQLNSSPRPPIIVISRAN